MGTESDNQYTITIDGMELGTLTAIDCALDLETFRAEIPKFAKPGEFTLTCELAENSHAHLVEFFARMYKAQQEWAKRTFENLKNTIANWRNN